MTIVNHRYQQPVGQGFFHSASLIRGTSSPALLYIYDCGAMERFAAARGRRIRRHVALTKRRTGTNRLDLLFLSHIHADHVNGLPELLDASSGLQVDTIVLPLVNVRERLIALARTASEDRASAVDPFYRDLIVDPASALERFEPRRIIFVRGSGPDGGAPDGDGRPLDAPTGPAIGDEGLFASDAVWKLVGRGRAEWADRSRSDGETNVVTFVIEDSIAFALSALHRTDTGTTMRHWLLAPYVDPGVVAGRDAFLRELARRCGVPFRRFGRWLDDVTNVRDLVLNGLDKLVGAYAMATGNLNITSLCLYSGPAIDAGTLPRRWFARLGCVAASREDRIAWLATGDAALKQKERFADFLNHYHRLLGQVSTLTLPHHGSDHNFHPGLLSQIRPIACVASAELFSKWKHPGPETVQAVCSHPAVLQVVTSKLPSRCWEVAKLG